MKKSFQRILLVLFAVLAPTLFNSCGENTVTSIYLYDIVSFNETGATIDEEPTLSARSIVDQYLREVGCFISNNTNYMYYEEATIEENNKKAINYFNLNNAKIDITELGERLEGLNVKFTYAVIGGSSEPNAASALSSEEYKFGSYAE